VLSSAQLTLLARRTPVSLDDLIVLGRAIDQYGQVIDVLVWARRDAGAARRFLRRAPSTVKVTPSEVVTDPAPLPRRAI
jgi:transposase-like protein